VAFAILLVCAIGTPIVLYAAGRLGRASSPPSATPASAPPLTTHDAQLTTSLPPAVDSPFPDAAGFVVVDVADVPPAPDAGAAPLPAADAAAIDVVGEDAAALEAADEVEPEAEADAAPAAEPEADAPSDRAADAASLPDAAAVRDAAPVRDVVAVRDAAPREAGVPRVGPATLVVPAPEGISETIAVFVNGTRRGTAPVQVELEAGEYEVRFEAAGRRSLSVVRLRPGERRTVVPRQLIRELQSGAP
jgi:hypothetical protein